MPLINHSYRLMTTAALLLVGLIFTLLLSMLFSEKAFASSVAAEVTGFAAAPTPVLYVNRAASGAIHDGTTWDRAFLTLQDALAVATVGQEIWVAAGIYYPDEGAGAVDNSETAAFALQSGVAIYGGFAGTENSRDERDWQQNYTVLSGDLTQNDPNKNGIGIITNPNTIVVPNAYQVVTALNVDDTAILDGFIITGGRADGPYVSPCGQTCGGGIYLEAAAPQLRNLTVSGNYAYYFGAAITAINGTLALENSIVQANRVEMNGGAFYLRNSGGQMISTVISGNRAGGKGGGIYTLQVSAPLTLTNVTMNGNRGGAIGGAIYNDNSTMLLKNALIWGNTATAEPEVSNRNGGVITFTDSLLRNAFPNGSWDANYGIDGGGNQSRDPLLTAAVDPAAAPLLAGDLHLQPLSPAADGGKSTGHEGLTDLDGAARIQGAAIDIGAYESPYVAQLAVAVTAQPAVIEYGEPVTYTVVLTNSGDAYAYSVQLTDTLPANVAFVSWGQQPAAAAYASGLHAVRWTGTVPAQQTTTFEFTVVHTGGPAETISNTVSYAHVTGSDAAQTAFTVLPLPTVDLSDVTFPESTGHAALTVTLSATTRKAVTLDYTTSSGTAAAGADFVNTTAQITVAPGHITDTIIIPVTADFIDEEDEAFTVALAAANDAILGDAVATATILDDDTAGAGVAPRLLSVAEPNGKATFTITLASQPVADVVVALSNSDTSECFAPSTVVVNASNWQQGVGVDVTAVDDFVVDGVQLCALGLQTASSDPHYDGMTLPAVTVAVHSDDVAGIGVTPTSLAINEQSAVGVFTVTLTSEPTATVTVDLASNDSSECTVPGQITLDATTWQQGIAVPVTAVDDDLDDGDQICTVQTTVTSADSNYDQRAMSDLPVTVLNDDTAGVAVTPTQLTTSEPNGQTTFGLSLTSEPVAPVTVHFTSQDPSECTVPPTLTLDQTNWDVQVSVLVSAVDDQIDDADQHCIVQTDVTSADPKYQDVATADVDVTVQDDTDTAGVILSKTTLTVGEPNTTDSFVVTLNSQPVNPITINFASQDSTECTVTSSVTLNATNWQQGRTVTVRAVDDESIDDSQSCVIQTTATAGASDAVYNGIAVVDPVVTVTDDDYADVLIGSPTVSVSEPNNSTIMILKLTSIPAAPVTVGLTSLDPSECAVPAYIIINATNWKSGVGATIFAVNDDVDDGDRTCNVKATISSHDNHYDGLKVADFPITVIDDDTAGTVLLPASLTVSEPNSSATFTIALTSEPTATVTVDLQSSDHGECSVPATIPLDATNWRNGVAVTVTAVDDAIDDETQACLVTTAASSADPKYQAIAIADLSVAVMDDDVAGVLVLPQQLTTSEPDGHTAFSITLTSEPTAAVTVRLQPDDPSECAVPATVTLDAQSWATGVTVPVQALDDRIDDADQRCVVVTNLESVDGDYQDIAAADVTVTVHDDGDTAGIVLAQNAVTVSEPTGTVAVTVTLTSEPVAPVTIAAQADDAGECRAAPITLDATNWWTGVALVASAVDDDVDDGTQPCTLQTTAVSADPLYDGAEVADVLVTVEDEDVAGIVQSHLTLTTTEPNVSAFYTVALTSEPLAAVDIVFTSSDLTECAMPAPIQLDAQTWRRGVAVPVTAVDDYRIDGPQPCVISGNVSSNDPLYQNAPLAPVTATVQDDDAAGIRFVAPNEQLSELTATAVFTVALRSEPTATVVVTLVSLDRSECTVPTTVQLTPENWRQGVPVMLSTVRDDTDDGTQSCTISALANSNDSDYNNLLSDEFEFMVEDANMVLMDVAFEPSTTSAEIGDVITYTYWVTNTGDVTLTLHAVDAALGAVSFPESVLQPGAAVAAHLLRTVLESDLPGPLIDSATITGRSPAGQILKATASATVNIAAHPQLAVNILRLGPPIVIPGTVVTYEVTLTNIGHIPAIVTNITSTPVRQPQAAALAANTCQAPLTIAAGSAYQCVLFWTATADENDTVTYVVTVDALGLRDFTATASGHDIVVVSSPTAADPAPIYLPLVTR